MKSQLCFATRKNASTIELEAAMSVGEDSFQDALVHELVDGAIEVLDPPSTFTDCGSAMAELCWFMLAAASVRSAAVAAGSVFEPSHVGRESRASM